METFVRLLVQCVNGHDLTIDLNLQQFMYFVKHDIPCRCPVCNNKFYLNSDSEEYEAYMMVTKQKILSALKECNFEEIDCTFKI